MKKELMRFAVVLSSIFFIAMMGMVVVGISDDRWNEASLFASLGAVFLLIRAEAILRAKS
jgi:hypothetical protein